MIRLFKNIQPATFFFIPFITLLLWLPAFFKGVVVDPGKAGILDYQVFGMIARLPVFLKTLIAVALASVEAVYLTIIVNKHEVLYKNTYLPALMYVVLMSFSSEVVLFHHALFLNFILILACDKIFSLFKNDNPASLIFDCGLLLSVASLFYFPSVLLFLFFLTALVILRSINIREWAIAFVAFGLPYFFLFVYRFVTDTSEKTVQEIFDLSKLRVDKLNVLAGIQQLTHSSFIPFIFFFFIMLTIALIKLRNNFYKNSIKTRSVQQVLIVLCFFLLAEILFLNKIELPHFTQLAVPCSVFLAYYYATAKKRLWLIEASFWIFIILIVKSYF